MDQKYKDLDPEEKIKEKSNDDDIFKNTTQQKIDKEELVNIDLEGEDKILPLDFVEMRDNSHEEKTKQLIREKEAALRLTQLQIEIENEKRTNRIKSINEWTNIITAKVSGVIAITYGLLKILAPDLIEFDFPPLTALALGIAFIGGTTVINELSKFYKNIYAHLPKPPPHE